MPLSNGAITNCIDNLAFHFYYCYFDFVVVWRVCVCVLDENIETHSYKLCKETISPRFSFVSANR